MISFGLLLAFFSSLGQTFLISLFVPHMLQPTGLSAARFASLYSLATLTSAALLPSLGRALDWMPLRGYAISVSAGLVGSCLVMASAQGWPSLLAGLLGLRLTGQGLLSHIASTAVARGSDGVRGKALGLSGLGYPLGEAVLPALVMTLIHFLGWRGGWTALAAIAVLVLLPCASSLSASAEAPFRPRLADEDASAGPLISDSRFYLLLPAAMVLPTVLTAVFFFQTSLAQARGWASAWTAAGLFGFAAARIGSSLAAGPWIDRLGAARLFPLFALPAAAGLLGLAGASSHWGLVAFLVLAGASQGIGGALKVALWAELYPIERLGEVRSAAAAWMILGTAAGPALMGSLLVWGWSYDELFGSAAALIGVASALAALGCRSRSAARPEGGGEFIRRTVIPDGNSR